MDTTNRRGFLRAAASVGASAIVADAAQLHARSEPPPGRVRAWRTTKDQKFQPIDSPQWEPWSGASSTGIQLDPGKRYQGVLGFGGSFTDASCYLFHQMSPEARHSLLSELYGPAGLQLSVGRTCIGSSDYSTVMYNNVFLAGLIFSPRGRSQALKHHGRYVIAGRVKGDCA